MAITFYQEDTMPRGSDTRHRTSQKILGALANGGGGGGSAYEMNVLLPFDAGADATPIDPTYMNANDVGTPPGAWTSVGQVPQVSTSQFKALTTAVIIDGGAPNFGSSTRSMRFSHATSGEVKTEFISAQRIHSVVLAGWFRTAIAASDNGTYDFVQMDALFNATSEFAIMQMSTSGTNDPNLKAHSSQGTGANISIVRNTWYWFVLRFLKATSCGLTIYNADSSLRGTSSIAFGANPEGDRNIRIGNVNPHGAFPAGDVFFANLTFAWGANPTYPVGP